MYVLKAKIKLKREIVTHGITEGAGIDNINVLLLGEIGNFLILEYQNIRTNSRRWKKFILQQCRVRLCGSRHWKGQRGVQR